VYVKLEAKAQNGMLHKVEGSMSLILVKPTAKSFTKGKDL
jgi:hypothetical protein